MAGSLNKVMLIGNLGRDPEIRATQDGREIANLAIATSETWKDRQSGERRERTEWHRVVIFNEGLVNVVKNYLKKGSKVFIEGQLQTRKWVDKDGQEKYSTEVVLQNYNGNLTMLDGKREGESYGGGASSGGSSSRVQDSYAPSGNAGSRAESFVDNALDDEIPF
jgi:single-strand DNA-binding protein